MKRLLPILFSLFFINLFAQTGTQIVYTHTNCPITNDSITWVEIDSNNVKWVGTKDGLYSFDNFTWTRYDVSNSNIPSNKIDMFRIAKDNTIWFVNNNRGFYKFHGGTFTSYNQSNLAGLTTDSLDGLIIDSLDLFFWTKHHGVIRYNTITSAVSTLDLSNTCLTEVTKLELYNNHNIYGLCPYPTTLISNPPQTKADSIISVFNFSFSNTQNLTINDYCFLVGPTYCTYKNVYTDKLYHRFEIFDTLISTGNLQQYLRSFDKNNTVIGYQPYNRPMAQQMYLSSQLFCYIEAPYAIARISQPPVILGGQIHYFPTMPPSIASNFDIDKYNNVWLATLKGLVAYNDSVLFLGNPTTNKAPFSIYPNPAQGQLYIKGGKTSCRASIINGLGKIVAYKSIQENKIDISDLAPGIYFIEITEESGRTSRHKFSKQ